MKQFLIETKIVKTRKTTKRTNAICHHSAWDIQKLDILTIPPIFVADTNLKIKNVKQYVNEIEIELRVADNLEDTVTVSPEYSPTLLFEGDDEKITITLSLEIVDFEGNISNIYDVQVREMYLNYKKDGKNNFYVNSTTRVPAKVGTKFKTKEMRQEAKIVAINDKKNKVFLIMDHADEDTALYFPCPTIGAGGFFEMTYVPYTRIDSKLIHYRLKLKEEIIEQFSA